jgi:hypothetical protein
MFALPPTLTPGFSVAKSDTVEWWPKSTPRLISTWAPIDVHAPITAAGPMSAPGAACALSGS